MDTDGKEPTRIAPIIANCSGRFSIRDNSRLPSMSIGVHLWLPRMRPALEHFQKHFVRIQGKGRNIGDRIQNAISFTPSLKTLLFAAHSFRWHTRSLGEIRPRLTMGSSWDVAWFLLQGQNSSSSQNRSRLCVHNKIIN